MGANGINGLIVPLDSHIIDRVFHHRPIVPIFVHEFPGDLAVGDRTFLYGRGGARVLEGEGGITGISYQTTDEVRGYGAQLCLSSEELDEYVRESGKSPADRMLVLKLEDHPVKYSRPLKCSMKVRSTGEYMTAEVYARILAENQ